jgi:hypothetical protein
LVAIRDEMGELQLSWLAEQREAMDEETRQQQQDIGG